MTTSARSAETAPAAGGRDELGPELELVVQRIRLRLGLRLAWLAHLDGRGLTDGQIATGDLDRLDDELAWRTANAPRELLGALDAAEQSLRRGATGRVGRLVELFGLAPPEVDLLHVCVATALDDRLGRVFAALHRDDAKTYPTEAVAARLCDRSGSILATAESPVRLWELIVEEQVVPAEAPAMRLDRTLAAWIQGVSELDHRLVGTARGCAAHDPLATWPVGAVADRCRPLRGGEQPDPTRIVVRGRSGSGRRSFAAAVCAELGLGALEIDTDTIAAAWDATFVAAERQAFLDRCALVWTGRRGAELPWPARVAHFPVQFLCVEPDDRPDELASLVDVVVDLPDPSLEDRWRLWRSYVPGSDEWPEPARSDIIERPHTIVGDIVDVGRQRATTPAAAREALRRRSRLRLGPLVTPMPLPYRLDDLVVPERVRASFEFLLFECRERRHFWNGGGRARLYPQVGLVALLAGPPGVGKTMAAQVLAAELGVDLLLVNLAETISKYVGDTAKHLDRILRDARDLDAVLLCDEADTLFGRRTDIRDAHDRWANADTNFLLQAIETFPGIALLATNRKDQLDEAFVRRLRHVIDVPRPDVHARRELWFRLLIDVDPGADEASFVTLIDRLATHVELTGAEIKHAVLNAGFLAERDHSRLIPATLLDGLDRELAKQGRSLSDHERRRILDA